MGWKTYGFLALLGVAAFFAAFGRESIYEFAADHNLDKFLGRPPATVLAFGDMMFDRKIREVGEKKGYNYIFSCLKPVLLDADLVIANLEGPITKNKSKSLGSKVGATNNYQFTFDPKVATALVLHNIGVVNLGNNHILNFGTNGLEQTISALSRAGITYFGEPSVLSASSTGVARYESGGWQFSFIGYNEFYHPSATNTARLIKEERTAGRLPIVYAHWGEEYATSSEYEVQKIAHDFVDAGAEIVLGSHPHVVQDHEVYNSKPIYYSLGNFIFDQYFDDNVRSGLGLRITFRVGSNPEVEELPIWILRDGRTRLLGDESCIEESTTTPITLPT